MPSNVGIGFLIIKYEGKSAKEQILWHFALYFYLKALIFFKKAETGIDMMSPKIF